MIEIADEHLREIRAHGERDYPFECCGLLIGRFDGDSKVVVETYAISNAREVRISVGIENIRDIIADIEHALGA